MKPNWFAVNRTIDQHPLFDDRPLWGWAWIKILANTDYETGDVCVTEVYRKLSDHFTHSSWRHMMKVFANEGMLELVSSVNLGRAAGYKQTATIKNWWVYQKEASKNTEKSRSANDNVQRSANDSASAVQNYVRDGVNTPSAHSKRHVERSASAVLASESYKNIKSLKKEEVEVPAPPTSENQNLQPQPPLEPEPASTYVYAEESGIFGNKPHGKQTASDENFFRGLMGDGFVRKISDPAALRRWRAEHGDDYIRLAAQVAKDPDLQPPGKKPIWLFEDYLVQCVTLPTPLMQFKRQDKAKDLERLQFERERPDLQDGDRVQWNRDMQFYTLYGGIVTGGFTLEERPDVGIVPAEQLLLVERPDYDWSEGAYLPTHTEIKQQQYAENALRDAA